MAMLVYGCRWWSDTENYAGANYGGFGPPRQVHTQTAACHPSRRQPVANGGRSPVTDSL